ncbi:alpha/beta fold hydrolase [Glycomyces algeriensis]|uniref:Hydrolase n=1 Tax=Glycomyces algeriensis TaxID=256037 RepID=A0A9W6G7M1_9ACTN|nr:alpha/beta hydrolase [Glycomyces algeriensis]MDA1364955.1 alpha/beta hydrolase [Glycomyces algeriensis]MDR7349984.1 pimeloyl-ACP methyl ester carboxylesterase [Glycomyces algeriensis]GLI42694.1 hydrolase [Glycomyces algeriensis]
MSINLGSTQSLELQGGTVAYDVAGAGPLVVLVHGIGEHRHSYREAAALLLEAGFRVARMDMRGHGESTVDWASYTRTDVAEDLLALIRHLGGPAIVVGHSFSGGAATIAAATEPDLVRGIVELGPFTRAQTIAFGALLTNARYRKGIRLLFGTLIFRSLGIWKRYLRHAVPGAKPAGFDEHLAALEADLRRPGRMAALVQCGLSDPTDAGAKLGEIACPAIVLMGTLDPDWADPAAEGAGIVAAMPAGLGTLEMVEGAGHYVHLQAPAAVAAAVTELDRSTTHA